MHTPFLKQVAERPDQLAICTPKRRLTYAETYQRACRVERELLDRGVEPNQMVGVLMAKGWEQVVAVLGIHFAGAAYLPIDSELPVERQRYLMENSGVKAVLPIAVSGRGKLAGSGWPASFASVGLGSKRSR